jgi:hypothetical protein
VFGPEDDSSEVAKWTFWRGNPEGGKVREVMG